MSGRVTLRRADGESGEPARIDRLRARGEAAFVALARLHAPAMTWVAVGYVGSRALAEEVVQETRTRTASCRTATRAGRTRGR